MPSPPATVALSVPALLMPPVKVGPVTSMANWLPATTLARSIAMPWAVASTLPVSMIVPVTVLPAITMPFGADNVPLLVMLPVNVATLVTAIALWPAVTVPVLVMPPPKLVTPASRMQSLPAVTMPPLLTPPARLGPVIAIAVAAATISLPPSIPMPMLLPDRTPLSTIRPMIVLPMMLIAVAPLSVPPFEIVPVNVAPSNTPIPELPAKTVPRLVMPPEKVGTRLTEMPSPAAAVIDPDAWLTISPENIEVSRTNMPASAGPPDRPPLLVIPPVKVRTLARMISISAAITPELEMPPPNVVTKLPPPNVPTAMPAMFPPSVPALETPPANVGPVTWLAMRAPVIWLVWSIAMPPLEITPASMIWPAMVPAVRLIAPEIVPVIVPSFEMLPVIAALLSWMHSIVLPPGLSNGALMTTQAANAGGAPPPISSAATELDASRRPILARPLILTLADLGGVG